MKRFIKSIILVFLAFVAVSCGNYDQVKVDFAGVGNVRAISHKEFEVEVLVKVNNPSIFKATASDVDMKIYLGDKELGTIQVEEIPVIERRSETTVTVPAKVYLNDRNFSLFELVMMVKNYRNYAPTASGSMTIQVGPKKQKIVVEKLNLKQLLR